MEALYQLLMGSDAPYQGLVYATGENALGELGLDDFAPRKEWTIIPEVSGLKSVSVQGNASAFLSKEGGLYYTGCSELNRAITWGQTGRIYPCFLGLNLQQVVLRGVFPTLLLTKEGELYGYSTAISLFTPPQSSLVKYKLPLVQKVFYHSGISFALTKEGKAYSSTTTSRGDCWEPCTNFPRSKDLAIIREHYQILITKEGLLYHRTKYDPHTTQNLPRCRAVSAGEEHLLVLTETSCLFVRGHSFSYQLGTEKITGIKTLVECQLPPLKEVQACYKASALITEQGNLYVAGYNRQHQLGLPLTEIKMWTRIEGLPPVRTVALGEFHSIALC